MARRRDGAELNYDMVRTQVGALRTRSVLATFLTGFLLLFSGIAHGIRPAPPPEAVLVAVLSFGPSAELIADGIRTGPKLPATVVDADDIERAAAQTQAGFVVARDAVWNMTTGRPSPLAKSASLADRVASAVELVAISQGRGLSPLARSGLLRGVTANKTALQSWAKGRAALREGQPRLAMRLLTKAARQAGFVRAQADLATALLAAKETEEGAKTADRALALDPSSPFARLAKARALDYSGASEEAAAAYEGVLELAPYEFAALNNLALIRKNQHDLAAAKRHLIKAVRSAPGSAVARVNLALVAMETNDLEQAKQQIMAALAIDGGWQIRLYNVSLLTQSGQVVLAKNELRKCEEDFRQHNPKAESLPWQIQIEHITIALADNAAAEAIARIDAMPAQWQQRVRVLTLKGRALEKLGKKAEAKIAYQAALATKEGVKRAREARMDLALVLAQESRFEESELLLDQAIQINPRDADAHYNRGVVALHAGDTARATELFKKAAEMAPHLTAAQYNLAILLARNGDRSAAGTQLEKLLERQPDHHAARLALSILLYRAGQRQEAMEHVERIPETDNEPPAELYCTRGILRLDAGQQQQAKSDLEQCQKRLHMSGQLRRLQAIQTLPM